MSYRTAFPDYVLDVTVPDGFVDSSVRDDGMPSFTNSELGLLLMADYPDPQQRLIPGGARFALLQLRAGDEMDVSEVLLETDNYNDILRYVERYRSRSSHGG